MIAGLPAKSVFDNLKGQRINRRRYESHAQAREDIFDYVERFDNLSKQGKTEALKRKDTNIARLPMV